MKAMPDQQEDHQGCGYAACQQQHVIKRALRGACKPCERDETNCNRCVAPEQAIEQDRSLDQGMIEDWILDDTEHNSRVSGCNKGNAHKPFAEQLALTP